MPHRGRSRRGSRQSPAEYAPLGCAPWPHRPDRPRAAAQPKAPPYHTDYPSRFGHLKPLSPPNISSFGLCHSSREETMALAMEMPRKSLTSTRGFASMDRETQLAIARKGGASVPNEKRSFSQNRRLAAEAGRKGGQSVNPTNRSFSRNHALASEAGRKGGHASHPGPKKAGDQE